MAVRFLAGFLSVCQSVDFVNILSLPSRQAPLNAPYQSANSGVDR